MLKDNSYLNNDHKEIMTTSLSPRQNSSKNGLPIDAPTKTSTG